MTKYKYKYRVEANRLRYWDYSASGRYFITICVENRECTLGDIKECEMILSEYGEIVKSEIIKMDQYHIRAIIDEWVIMPNHIHLLVELVDDEDHAVYVDSGDVEKIHEFSLPIQLQPLASPSPPSDPWWNEPNYIPTADEVIQYRKQRRRMIIPKMVGKLKMQTSKQINIKRDTAGVNNWHPNYHDHIIRDNNSYERIKNYIISNPQNWDEDTFR